MKIVTLEIENFRAISKLRLDNLKEMVLIAGSNGAGKSCIFDAIRLFKSLYGEYSQNELSSWFSEFQLQINPNSHQILTSSMFSSFQDANKQIRIYLKFTLSIEERTWIKNNVDLLLKNYMWKKNRPQHPMAISALSEQINFFQHFPLEEFNRLKQSFLLDLDKASIIGQILITPNQEIKMMESLVLHLLFSIYKPDSIGVIDYHAPQRTFNREPINQINLSLETSQQNYGASALYNTANKYNNIKTEMASSYIRNLLSIQAGQSPEKTSDLNRTLDELFATFFPDKSFLGVQPTQDGKMTFNVKTSYGSVHDIDGLSSGEKEILYGYLRLRNSSHRNSILLIDEPELHLNPKLTQGLPLFYYNHLGKALDNQIWLVTHSDALLRQSIGQLNFSVYHIQRATSESVENQVKEIAASDEIEQAIIDLVGDLAAYRPGAKLVIVEGGGNSEFDVHMIKQLFPDFDSKVNLESGGSKKQVSNFHHLLEKAQSSGAITTKFYSIADKDFETTDYNSNTDQQNNTYFWDRFHIENYLLETHYILKVVKDLQVDTKLIKDESDLENILKICAKQTIRSLIRGRMEHLTNQKLVKCIRTNTDRNSDDVSEKLTDSIETSIERLTKVFKDELSSEKLKQIESDLKSDYEKDLLSENWKISFRGRDVLRQFVAKHLKGINYELFRNLIITKMKNEEFQPIGMKKVLDEIISL